MNKKHREAMIDYGLKIAGLEEIARRQAIMYDAFAKRLEELDEGLDCLKRGANKAGQDLLQRVRCLEQIQDVHQQKVTDLEKVKDATHETNIAQALAIDVLRHRIKENSTQLAALTNKYLEQRPKQHDTAPVSTKKPAGCQEIGQTPEGRRS